MSFITTNYKHITSMQRSDVRQQTKQENIAEHKSKNGRANSRLL